MTERDEPPSAIEGKEILGSALKISPSSAPKRYNGYRVYPVTMERRAEAKVVLELDEKDERFFDDSMVSEGDQIQGRQLWGWTSTFRLNLKKGGSGRSASHTGQSISLPDAVMCLVEGWRGEPAYPHPKDRALLGRGPLSIE